MPFWCRQSKGTLVVTTTTAATAIAATPAATTIMLLLLLLLFKPQQENHNGNHDRDPYPAVTKHGSTDSYLQDRTRFDLGSKGFGRGACKGVVVFLLNPIVQPEA